MPISDTRIWTGSEWQSLVGPTGPAGPIVVSTDAGQVAKLGTDGKLLVAQADLDARFVNITGDTMTGALAVSQNSVNSYAFAVVNGASYTYLNGATYSSAFFGPRPANDGFCSVRYGWSTLASNNDWGWDYSANSVSLGQRLAGADTPKLTISSTGDLTATGSVAGTAVTATGGRSAFNAVDEAFAIGVRYNAAGTINYIGTNAAGAFQVSASTGNSMVTITSTGNITSTGTAHNFAANSITASAILGLPVAATVLPLVDAATAVVGVSAAYARADHVHPLPTAAPPESDCNFYQAGRTITAADRGKLIVNNSNDTTQVTFLLPADSVFPVGTRLDFVDASNAETWIQAPAGGQLVYSSTLTSGGGAGTSVIAVGRVRLATPYFRLTAIKVKPNEWMLLN